MSLSLTAINPLEHNWSVKFCSHEIYPDGAAFEAALADGRVRQRIREVLELRDEGGGRREEGWRMKDEG